MGVIDNGFPYEELEAGVSAADLIIICTPIQRIVELLPDIVNSASAGALVTDVGSTKRTIARVAASCARDDVYFLGGHPMAGSEKSGVTAADPFLFENAYYILVGDNGVAQPQYDGFRDLVRSIGARVVELAATAHDEVVAAISHLPQMMATTLVEMVGRLDDEAEGTDGHFLPLAAGGFRDMTRIASSPFAPVWEDICASNEDQIKRMIDTYISLLSDVRERVGDRQLSDDFARANEVRNRIPRDMKGFIHPLFELLVVAEDKPGVIADIAVTLSREEININDIEIVKVREGEGGTMRLGFDSSAAATRSLEVLNGMGYEARRP
jgi:prephenate dehydrogenase